MMWLKLGQIFNPNDHSIPQGGGGFAQSPQALVFEEFVRIYFSTRAVDSTGGKVISNIAFVDFEKDLRTIIRVSEHAVIERGALGCFDEHGIFPVNVLRVGGLIYAYTCGWSRRVSVSVETAIGLAISHDQGNTFQRVGNGPVMGATLHEPNLVGDAFVQVVGDTFHMWYIFGAGWRTYPESGNPERTYKIGHAVSRDGVHWDKEEGRQIIDSVLGVDECQALPTVVEIGGAHHMFFCFRHASDFRTNPKRGYRIGHAHSTNLKDWTRDDASMQIETSADGWDSEMLCYPHAFSCDGRIYLLYNGNAFGREGFGAAILQ